MAVALREHPDGRSSRHTATSAWVEPVEACSGVIRTDGPCRSEHVASGDVEPSSCRSSMTGPATISTTSPKPSSSGGSPLRRHCQRRRDRPSQGGLTRPVLGRGRPRPAPKRSEHPERGRRLPNPERLHQGATMRARAIEGRALGKPPYGYRRGSDHRPRDRVHELLPGSVELIASASRADMDASW